MATVTVYPVSHLIESGSWKNPTNVYSYDASYMTINPPFDIQYWIYVTFSPCNIPVGSTINSITTQLRYRHSSSIGDIFVMLQSSYNDVEYGNYIESTSFPTSDTILQCSETQLWTINQLNDGKMGAWISVYRDNPESGNTVYFDYVCMTVDYTSTIVVKQGSSSQIVRVSTQGNGGVIKSRSSSQIVTVPTQGSGYALKSKSSSQIVTILTQGSGGIIKSRSSSQIVTVITQGSGSALKSEGSSAIISILTEQSGIKSIADASSSDITVSSEGDGLKSNDIIVVVSTEGNGTKVITGISNSTNIITGASDGLKTIQNGNVATVNVSATGLRTILKYSGSGISVIVKSAGEGLTYIIRPLHARSYVYVRAKQTEAPTLKKIGKAYPRNTETEAILNKTKTEATTRKSETEVI